MTREVVIGILKSLMEHGKVDAAEYHALGCAISELETKPSKNGTTAWMDMPESPNDAQIEKMPQTGIPEILKEINRLVRNTDISINDLRQRITQNDTVTIKIWNEVQKIKAEMPKEWGK